MKTECEFHGLHDQEAKFTRTHAALRLPGACQSGRTLQRWFICVHAFMILSHNATTMPKGLRKRRCQPELSLWYPRGDRSVFFVAYTFQHQRHLHFHHALIWLSATCKLLHAGNPQNTNLALPRLVPKACQLFMTVTSRL